MSHAEEAQRLLGMVAQDLEHDLDPEWDMRAAEVEALLAIAGELRAMREGVRFRLTGVSG